MEDIAMVLGNFNPAACFSKQDYYKALVDEGCPLSYESFLVYFQNLFNTKAIQRVGRNRYQVSDDKKKTYSHHYSEVACSVAECLKDKYPFLDYVVFETVQLNEFLNHQIARNTIFVFLEKEVIDFAFATLRENFDTVLVTPSLQDFHRYRNDNTIVLLRLVSEAPKHQTNPWETSLEKLLVDIMAEKTIQETFSNSEYDAIYNIAYERYIIDESKMFRYARRRSAREKLLKLLESSASSMQVLSEVT